MTENLMNHLNFVCASDLKLLFKQELYKTTEELQEKKADKQMVESEIVSGFIWTYERWSKNMQHTRGRFFVSFNSFEDEAAL